MKIERRGFNISLRNDDGGDRMMVGTPIVYGQRSEDLGFYEFVLPGAAADAIKTSDARALYGHNSKSLLPLGRQSAGTLRLTERTNGVFMELDPPKKNPFVDALIESIERGDIREMSYGFHVLEDAWTDLDKETPTRTIIKLKEIRDVSYIAFAAYPQTTAGVRSRDDYAEALQSLENARIAAGRGGDPTGGRARFDRGEDEKRERFFKAMGRL